MQKRRILYIHHGIGIGGAPTSLAAIVESLDTSLYHPIVVTRPSSAVQLFKRAGAEVLYCGNVPQCRHTTAGGYSSINPLLYWNWISSKVQQQFWKRLFQKLEPDIVHFNSITLLPLCRSAKAVNSKVVVHVRESVLFGNLGIRKRWIAKELSNHADAVIHISEYDRTFLDLKTPIVEVIPNWVDFDVFDRNLTGERVRQELEIGDSVKVVVTLGGVTPIKGTKYFLEAANLLKHRNDYVFVIAGLDFKPNSAPTDFKKLLRRIGKFVLRVDNRERLQGYYSRHNLENSVKCLGYRLDIAEIIAASDVLVFPASRPHQARPIMEAGAMAKPAIASDFECIREYVTHGENGLLIPPKDPYLLRDAIAQVLDFPDQAFQMGEKNYKNSLRYHDMKVNAPKLLAIYERLQEL